MTIKEVTGKRDLEFSGWIRKNLPDSKTGFLVSDLDFIVYNYKTKRMLLLEVKTHNSEIKTWQEILFKNISRWIQKGIDNDWTYLGFHILKFEKNSPEDGKMFLDDKEISKNNLIKFLSLDII